MKAKVTFFLNYIKNQISFQPCTPTLSFFFFDWVSIKNSEAIVSSTGKASYKKGIKTIYYLQSKSLKC